MTTRHLRAPGPGRPVSGPRAAAVGGLALLAGLATACGAAGDPSAEVATAPTELSAHDGEPCPEELPRANEESHGFGADAPATEAPSLPTADEAWLCSYDAEMTHRRDDGGAVFVWQRRGAPRPLDEDQLADAQLVVDALEPPPRNRACTADLGPRWMVVLNDGGDLTGVVVDDYGCHDVRLTPDPHGVVPGEGHDSDVVTGVLDGGAALLRALAVGRGPR